MNEARQILVVEDEFLIAMELEQMLQSAGFRVLGPAPSVRRALELLQQERPAAAVLDVNLGGERVTPVAELLRTLTSAYRANDLSNEEVLRNVVNLGKPTPPQRLLQALRHLFEGDKKP